MAKQHAQRAALRHISADIDLLGNAIAPIDYTDAQLIVQAALKLMKIADEIMSDQAEAALLKRIGPPGGM
jgi:hypothetical protein